MPIAERRPLGRPSSARSSGWDGARAICRHRWPRSALIPFRVNRQVPDRDHGVRCCRLRGRRSPRGGAALRRQAPRGCRGRLQGAPGRQEAVLRGQGGPAPERGAGEAHWGCGVPRACGQPRWGRSRGHRDPQTQCAMSLGRRAPAPAWWPPWPRSRVRWGRDLRLWNRRAPAQPRSRGAGQPRGMGPLRRALVSAAGALLRRHSALTRLRPPPPPAPAVGDLS